MIYVIGSGPAGISASVALLNKGLRVTLLDVGYELESSRSDIVRRMRSLPKEQWNKNDIDSIKENMDPHSEGVNLKYLFGSDYPYRGMDSIQPVKLNNSKMVRTLAKGGLSSIWGASILPFLEEDINDWPIPYNELEFHYQEVLKFMPIAGIRDDLYHFSLCLLNLNPSRQVHKLLTFTMILKRIKMS